MDKDGFIKAMLLMWSEHDWCDLDGGDLQEMCEKHGLLIKRPATEEDCQTEQGREWDMEPGDTFCVWSDEARALLAAQKEPKQ